MTPQPVAIQRVLLVGVNDVSNIDIDKLAAHLGRELEERDG